MKKLKLKTYVQSISILGICLFMMSLYSCEKKEGIAGIETNQESKLYSAEELLMVDTSFVVLDSTDSVRTFTVYNACAVSVGTLTTSNKKLNFTGQTSTTVTITGTTSLALTKGAFYFFKPNGCSSGNYYLKVKFNTNIQPLCNYFKLSSCTWSALGSCSIVNTYSFVSVLPTPCS